MMSHFKILEHEFNVGGELAVRSDGIACIAIRVNGKDVGQLRNASHARETMDAVTRTLELVADTLA